MKLRQLPLILASGFLLMAGTIPAPAADPVEFQVGAFFFHRPVEWKWVNPESSMRKAELEVPGTGGAAEVTFFHFGKGQGGSVQANLQRWLGQFEEPIEELDAKQAEQKAGETDVTMIQAKGTFLSGMPGGPATALKDYALLGAILQDADGDVYVKMTGPAATVEAAAEEFEKMILRAAGGGK